MANGFSTSSSRFPHDFDSRLSIVLYEPEIPLNVGSIARTCVCTGVPLHLVGTLGFRLDNRLARRAGLDYWEHAEVHVHRTWDEFANSRSDGRIVKLSTKGQKTIWDMEFRAGDFLVFGSERTGLPPSILENVEGDVVAIPMIEGQRSLNLSNSVSIVLYEALRQILPK